MKFMHLLRLHQSDRGAALIIVLGVLFALSIMALASVETSETEKSIAANTVRRTQAFLAAEAGMARAEYIFNQNPLLTVTDTLLDLMNADTILGTAYFKMAMDSTLPRRKVIAVGYATEGQSGIQVLYEHGPNRDHIWNNAVFLGNGASGRGIEGRSEFHGSVHILGSGESFVDANSNGVWDGGEAYQDANHDGSYDPPIPPDSVALDLSGSGTYVRNDYSGLIGNFSTRMPVLPTQPFGTETVQSLQTELRVQHGQVKLGLNGGGDSEDIGQANATGGTPQAKETADGVYVTDGFAGDSPSGLVYSDNGSEMSYDRSQTPPDMPNLDEPFTDPYGTDYPTYMAYLKANALVLSDSLRIDLGTSMPLVSSGFGSLSVNSLGEITGSGIIYVEGNITVADGPGDFIYEGKFTLVAEGDIILDEDLLSDGTFATSDALGIVTPGTVRIGTSTNDEPELMIALFAQEEVRVETSRTYIAGTVVTNHLDLDETLEVYQAPALTDNLPPGMPGSHGKTARSWRQVPRSWVELE